MKLITWLKEKFNFQPNPTSLTKTHSVFISLDVVAPLNKQPAPVIESEILAEQPIYSATPRLLPAPQPSTTCFPELATLLKSQNQFLKTIKLIMCQNKSCDYTPTTVGTQLMTDIGQWLQGEGKQLSTFAEYQDVVQAHTQFNRCAGAILVHHQRGEFLNAVNMLNKDLVQHSIAVENSLRALLIRVRHDCCPQCKAHNDELTTKVTTRNIA